MRGVGICLLLVAALSTGCTQEKPVPNPTPSIPSVVATGLPEGWSRCVNHAQGWSIGYPEAWFTTDAFTDPLTGRVDREPTSACKLFDPKKFVIPRYSEFPTTALEIERTRIRFDRAIRYATDPANYRTILRETWVVMGLPAVRLEAEARGLGLTLKGTHRYGWVIDLGAQGTFSVFAVGPPDVPLDRYRVYRAFADRAVATLEIPSAGVPPS